MTDRMSQREWEEAHSKVAVLEQRLTILERALTRIASESDESGTRIFAKKALRRSQETGQP